EVIQTRFHIKPYTNQDDNVGGRGVRVAQIKVKDLLGKEAITNYSYKDAEGKSSGTVIYEPLTYERGNVYTATPSETVLKHFEDQINYGYENVLIYGHLFPSSNVMYGRVAVSNIVAYEDGKVSREPRTTVFEQYTLEDIRYDR